jgi:hypothetical protein
MRFSGTARISSQSSRWSPGRLTQTVLPVLGGLHVESLSLGIHDSSVDLSRRADGVHPYNVNVVAALDTSPKKFNRDAEMGSMSVRSGTAAKGEIRET